MPAGPGNFDLVRPTFIGGFFSILETCLVYHFFPGPGFSVDSRVGRERKAMYVVGQGCEVMLVPSVRG